MGRLILIAKLFDVEDYFGNKTGRKELLVDYAIDEDTYEQVCVPGVHPEVLGAKFCKIINEWVID